MKVTYIHHSGFAVALEHACLLFDYEAKGIPVFPKDKTIYVFVSHIHQDHFNKEIFNLVAIYPNIYFILDQHILCPIKNNVVYVKPHQIYDVHTCRVETLKSNDEGVAFVVEIEGKRIYHAGDLNWWDWGEEDTLAESKRVEDMYKKELARIQHVRFDLAFVPVDPRLKDACGKGLQVFMDTCDVEYVIPMHFWNDTSIFKSLKELPYAHKILMPEKENCVFEV